MRCLLLLQGCVHGTAINRMPRWPSSASIFVSSDTFCFPLLFPQSLRYIAETKGWNSRKLRKIEVVKRRSGHVAVVDAGGGRGDGNPDVADRRQHLVDFNPELFFVRGTKLSNGAQRLHLARHVCGSKS